MQIVFFHNGISSDSIMFPNGGERKNENFRKVVFFTAVLCATLSSHRHLHALQRHKEAHSLQEK